MDELIRGGDLNKDGMVDFDGKALSWVWLDNDLK